MSSTDRRGRVVGSPTYELRTWPRRYGFALLAVAVATLVRYALGTFLGFSQPHVLFYPTILLVAMVGGFGPGIFATLLSTASAAYFFLPPLNSFVVSRTRDIVGLVLSFAIGTAITGLADLSRRREARLREYEKVVEGLEEMIVVVDREYRYVMANRAFLSYHGMQREQLIGRRAPEVWTKEVFETTVKQKLQECFQGKVIQCELRYKYPMLGERDLAVSCLPIEGPSGIDRVACVLRDTTERKQAEDALRDSEDRYRDLVEHSEDLLCTHDLQGKLLSANPAPARVLGYEVAELLQIPMRQLIAPEYREQFDQYLAKIRTNGADKGLMAVLTRTGERRIWEYHNTLRTQGLSSPIVRGMAHDVTERKRAEKALRLSEENYRRFVSQSSEGIFRQDLDAPVPIDLPEDELVHHILHDSYLAECNDAIAKMYGLNSVQDFIGKRLSETLDPDNPRNIELTREYVRSGFRVLERESHEVDIHGNPKVFLNSMIGIVENGRLLHTWGIQRDITERVQIEEARRKAEEALRESESHFRLLVEQASDGIFIADAQGRYLDGNSAGAEMLGYSRAEILRLSIADIVASEEIPRIAAEIARFVGGNVVRTEWKIRRKDGSFFPGEVVGRQLPDGRLQGILRDITERKQAEESLRRSEERFRVALKNSPVTVFHQDRDLRYTWVYNPHLDLEGEILGKTDDEIVGSEASFPLNEIKRRVLETGVGCRVEIPILRNGEKQYFDLTLEPLLDAAEAVIGITGASMDIAKLHELTDHLQEQRDKLVQEKIYLESEIQSELGFEKIIGHSPALKEVLKQARVVAPTGATVLLLGETGTGKELVARSVHQLSSRRDKNFIKLNCAAVPSGLLESELFGHEKGAFTGAISQKLGRIELADKGTLFLDEIGELPLELQPKLLRVLQDQEFERLGGIRTQRVDVRIIAATNRDLLKDVTEKKFREDLYYRLNVFPIRLPALRDRRFDIPLLVTHFVRKHASRMNKQIEGVSKDTMAALSSGDWPGNIRELENLIERLVISARGPVLLLPPGELEVLQESQTDDTLSERERQQILGVLRDTNGVLSGPDGAAERLGVKRTTLQSMIKRLNIEPRDYRRRRDDVLDSA